MPVEGKGQETRSDHWISGSFQGLGPYLYTFGLHLQQRLGKGRISTKDSSLVFTGGPKILTFDRHWIPYGDIKRIDNRQSTRT